MARYTVAIAALVAAFSFSASAHGPAKWVQDGQYKNAIGELCCGENDCGLFVSGSILRVSGGYQVDAEFEGVSRAGAKFRFPVKGFVKDQDATPSPTGEYWACSWGGSLKCFFFPLPGA